MLQVSSRCMALHCPTAILLRRISPKSILSDDLRMFMSTTSHNNNSKSNTDCSNCDDKTIKVTATSAAVPPLVRSLLLKAVSLLSSQTPSKTISNQSQTHDPVSSLFLRSGSSTTLDGKSNHGLEFLVSVSKTPSSATENSACILESENTPPLSNISSRLSFRQRLGIYLALGKARLSALVVLTSSFGYGLALASSSAATISPVLHFTTFASCTLGTAFLAVGANTLNQFCEAPYDSQMPRTRNRPLAVRALSPEHALVVGISSSLIGAAVLAAMTNPVTTSLGIANCLLYAGVYTPMKRTSSYNTWIGAVVGALPPLMGWSAATGGHLDSGACVLACILFSWQFPHFMALSWNMRAEYARAGYQVLSVVHPQTCRKAAMRHSVALTAMCSLLAPVANLAPWSFALVSLPVNAYLLRLAYQFRHYPDASTARSLFRYSLAYLPTLLTLLALTNYFGR